MNNHDHRELTEIDAACGGNNGFVEITEDELKQVTGGTSKLPGMPKTPDVTLKCG